MTLADVPLPNVALAAARAPASGMVSLLLNAGGRLGAKPAFPKTGLT